MLATPKNLGYETIVYVGCRHKATEENTYMLLTELCNFSVRTAECLLSPKFLSDQTIEKENHQPDIVLLYGYGRHSCRTHTHNDNKFLRQTAGICCAFSSPIGVSDHRTIMENRCDFIHGLLM